VSGNPAAHNEHTGRYADILKSMSLIGGSQLVSIVLSVVRLKVIAILLGPTGIGLLGLYNVVLDLASSLAGLGVQASGVRQVAIAVASGDTQRIAAIGRVLNLVALCLGLIGAGALVLMAGPVSTITFGEPARASAVALLGMALFLRVIAGAPLAIIQGSRRMGDLARVTVVGALLNTAAAVPLIYIFGEDGIVPSLVAVAFTSWIAALWYGRDRNKQRVKLTLMAISAETRMLLSLGFAFMASGLLVAGAAFVIRIIIAQQGGVEAAGNYQAAWALGGVYVGFILQAMGTDFYPRLSGLASDHDASNRLVNEQARVSLLLAGPGLLATLVLSPAIIALFYSAEFGDAVRILQWLCMGMLLRVMAWPMGYLILAKGRQQIFFWTELAAAAVHVGLAWLLVNTIGPIGAGIAFAGLYLWHAILIGILVRRMTGFTWSRENVVLGGSFFAMTGLALLGVELLPPQPALVMGLAMTALACWFALTQLVRIVPQHWVPSQVRPVVYRLLRYKGARATAMVSSSTT
jgi:antigen flippase